MDKITLIPSAIVVNDHIAYMFSQYVNLLYSYDLDKKETRLLSSIPEEEFFTSDLCGKILLHNEYLILIPLRAKKIWKYNIKTKEWHGIDLRPLVSPDSLKFYQAILSDNNVIMIGCMYPSIVTLDLFSGKLDYYTEAFDYFSDCASDDAYFRVDYAMKDRDIYLASCKTNVVVKINLDNYKCNFYEVGEKGNTYSGIAYDGENFWLSPRLSTSIVKWDGEKMDCKYDLPESIPCHMVNYLGVISYNNKIIFPGHVAPTIQIVNDNLNFIDKRYSVYQCNKDFVTMVFLGGDVFFENDIEGIVEIKCHFDRDLLYKYINGLNRKWNLNNTLIENRTVDVKLFLAFLV